MEEKKRQIAYKIWISNILNNKYVKQEGWKPNYMEINGYKVSRVNLIANVIAKFEGDVYASIVLDDGSSAIRLKSWGDDVKKLENVDVGDMVLVIARPKEFNEEIYLIPEIIRKINNPNWELLRKAELLKSIGKPELNGKAEEKPISGDKQKVLEILEKQDKGEGVKIEDVIYISGLKEEDVSNIIKELLQWGEIYEAKPNYIKII